MKIGLYFGSFNPPHKAHIGVANYVVNELSLDKLKFVISPQNPFKINYSLCDIEHRINMTKLAIEGSEKLEVSDIETKLPTPSYTIDTLHKIIEENGNDDEYYIIMGFDNFVEIDKWKDYEEIVKLSNIVVLPRTSDVYDSLNACKNSFNEMKDSIIKKTDTASKIILLDNAPMSEISSTFIRGLISIGKPITEYVEESVDKYISEHGLFRATITIPIETYRGLIEQEKYFEQKLADAGKRIEELSFEKEKLYTVKEFLEKDVSFLERLFQWKQIMLAIKNY